MNTHLFTRLNEVRDQTQNWLWECNKIRPHNSLEYESPINFMSDRKENIILTSASN
ncbi:MAG: integrase core domain-containing protein [Crocinitomicaceae bacterium]|nr:integrase core domain-containing protein [Crocinitomicaceae bacterium]